MKHSKLIHHLVVIMQVSALTLGTGQAQTISKPNLATGVVSAAQAQSSRMKTVTNAQRKAAAAQARAQRVTVRRAAKAAAQTRITQPATSATVNAAAAATVAASPNAVTAANTTTLRAAALPATMLAAPAVQATIAPGQITDPFGNPILNQQIAIGIPGSTVANPNVCQPGVLDYFNCGNYANSPLPEPAQLNTTDPIHPTPALDANGFMIPAPGTGLKKFIDTVAGVGLGNQNNLGNYIPIATPGHATLANGVVDTASDYYQIELKRYTQRLHSNLPPTVLQGYHDAASGADQSFHYLGPIIFAKRDVPVRVKFTNGLPTGSNGNLFLPIDKTMKGAGIGPDGKTYYGENRSLLHLHGGITPWISDGTPHQWITPAGDPTPFKKGASQQNVPDMVQPPADGSGGWDTWYYTNQQSARMLWYHDHSYAMTRHNVYAGEAAPYLISDKWEEDLISGTNITGTNPNSSKLLPNQAGLDKSGQGAYRYGIPLVIQDKTFVPPTVDKTGKLPAPYSMDQLMAEDPTWFSSTDISGTHPVISTTDGANDSILGQFGQLWFPHVFMPNQNPNDPSTVVNGYGRWDYGAWVWPPVTGLKYPPITNATDPIDSTKTVTIPPFPNPSAVQEAFMDTPVVNGTAYPKMTVGTKAYRFRILNASNDRHWNLQFYYATDANGNVCKPATDPSVCTEVKMVPSSPMKGMPPTWPTDGRDGGVPDWNTAGPDIIQIGSDSGFLPAPVVIPSQPVNYEYNRRVITALNVSDHALLLGPAERADVIVDFSNVPDGAVLILYNDAPAPNPGFDARLDYYTGNPDQSDSGGTPTTIPGYGPNTRTVMQFVVSSAVDGGTGGFNLGDFRNAMKTIYPAEQKAPLVPAQAYGNASNIYAKIQDVTYDITQGKFVDSSVNTGTDVALVMKPKSIAEEFDTDWGRMTAQLGVELPFTNFLTQTTVQMWMFDPPTEIATAHDGAALNPDDVQIWRVTHNGVDTHSVHFHMFDVQLVNRVAWDGTMYPPDANEMGWKETVRMNPLTDAIIALRPIKPTLPFSLTDSFRPLDPTSPLDTAGPSATTPAFTNVDPITNNPITVANQLVNFGWEYVWHCHLLGHEENDMMRPIVVKVEPEVPTIGTAARRADFSVDVSWTNNAASATGFDIQRATDAAFTQGLTTFHIAPSVTATSQLAIGTPGLYKDSTAIPSTPYFYRAAATKLFNNPVMETAQTNILSSKWSGYVAAPTAQVPSASVNPLALTFGITPLGSSSTAQPVTISNVGGAALSVTGITLTGGDFTQTNNCATVAPNASCTVNVAFRPSIASAPGGRTGTLNFHTNDPQHGIFTVALSGTGTALSISPMALTFGTTSGTQTVTVLNLGTTTLTRLGFTKAGANAADFTVTALGGGGCGTTLLGRRSCTISVRFAPTAAGIHTASVIVGSSDPAGTQSVSLTGGVNPAITVIPAGPLTFSSTLGTKTAAQAVTVTSTGNWPVSITGIIIGGSNGNQFAQTSNCPATLAVNANCTVSLTFTPTSAGNKTGSATINVGAPATSQSVTLSGTVAIPVTVTPTVIGFGTVNRGQVSPVHNVTVTNSGSTAATINPSLTFDLLSNGQFAMTNGCGGSVAANSSCTIGITFKPTNLIFGFGGKTATLNINIGGQGVSAVSLTGTAR